jgi:hypothetical protein
MIVLAYISRVELARERLQRVQTRVEAAVRDEVGVALMGLQERRASYSFIT